MKKELDIVAKLDFTSKRKAMSTIVSSQNGKNMLLKGAPDRILEKCTSYMSLAGTNKMSDQDRRAFSK